MSAHDKGRRFQTLTRDYLRARELDVLEEGGSGLAGGDLAVRTGLVDIAAEVKNQAKMDLPGWWRQAKANARPGELAAVVHKRKGSTEPGEQWVTLSLEDFAALVEAAS